MALVKTVEMRVLAKAGDAQEKLDELAAKADKLDGDSVKMRFRMDDAEGKAQLDAIEARAKKLGFEDVRIKVKVDGKGRAIADLEAIKHEEDSAARRGLLDRLVGGAGGGIPGALGPIPLPAVAAAIPLVGALATEIVGVAAGFAAAATGAGAFAALAMPAVKSVENAYQRLHAAQQKYQAAQAKEALDPTKANASAVAAAALNLKLAQEQITKLPASEQAAIKGIQGLSGEFGKMSRAFQPQVFKVFADGLKSAENILPHLTQFATPFATALDGLLQKLAKFTASKGFSDWLAKFSKDVGPAVTAIGTGIGNVANSFGKLMTIMSGKDVAHAINIAFGAISGTINVVASGIQRFMQNWDGMSAAAAHAAHGVSSAFDEVRHAVASLVTSVAHGVADVVTTLGTLPAKIIGVFAGAGRWLVSAGADIIRGLITGIESMIGAAVSAAEHAGSAIVGAVKGFLHIGSPSKVMHLIGQQTIDGLIAGMHMGLPALEAMAKKAAAIIASRVKTEITYAKTVAAATLSGLNLTSIDLTQGNVATGMQSYLASIKAFIAEIKQLSSQHLNKSLLQQLIAAGPVTGGQYAQSILQGGGAAPVNALYKQIQQQSALLGAQAAMAVYGGKAAPHGDTYNINVQGGLITDKQALALAIVKILQQYKRHNGGRSIGLA